MNSIMEQITNVAHQKKAIISHFLALQHVIMHVGDHCVGVYNTMMDIGYNQVGIYREFGLRA